MASIGLPTEGLLSGGGGSSNEDTTEGELPGLVAAGQPGQGIIIRDSQVRGRDVVVEVDSQYGPHIGITVPSSGNTGALSPVVTGDPTDETEEMITVFLARGGGLGTAEWLWKSEDPAVGWNGAHNDHYIWGMHAPTEPNVQGAVVVYSSLFQRVLIAGHNTSDDNISIRWVDINDRPMSRDKWDQNTTVLTPSNGIHQDHHALAICELRDGSLLMVVRQEEKGAAADAFNAGDLDIYKSVNGGQNWKLTVANVLQTFGEPFSEIEQRATIRIAASGDWVRLVCVLTDGSLGTLISADGGSTWTSCDLIEQSAGGIEADNSSVQENDVQPFDLVAVDDSTGAFLLVCNPEASGDTNKVGLFYATRDENWDQRTGLFETGNPEIPSAPKSYLLYRDPYYVWLWIFASSPGNGADSDFWTTCRVERDRVLQAGAWTVFNTPLRMHGCTRLVPMQARAVWCGDRAAFIGYLTDIEVSTPFPRKAARPWFHWVGGWSRRPAGCDFIRDDGRTERVHWSWVMGEPKGGATSSTQSNWTSTTSSGGTHSWEASGYVRTDTFALLDSSYFSLDIPTTGTNPLPRWDPDADDLAGYEQKERFALEWVCAVGQTAQAVNTMGVRFKQPSLGGGGWGWTITVRHYTDRLEVRDDLGGTVLATFSDLALDTLEQERFHRIRFVVAPATSPSNPQARLQYRREDGDDWRESSIFSLPGATSAAGHTMQEVAMGILAHNPTGGLTHSMGWRELHGWGPWFRPDYCNLSLPTGLPGAIASARPRGFTTGSSAHVGGLAVAWGGIGGDRLDQWESRLAYDYPVEAITLDSPQLMWMSTAGATAGQRIVYDACRGANTDDGRRFAHKHAAIFGLTGHRAQVIYSDNSDGTGNDVTVNINTTQYTGLRVDAISGRVLSVAATNGYAWREGELAGRYLRFTAGTSVEGHVHKVETHRFDGTNHLLVLATGSQFAPTLIPVGATASVFADRAWVEYDETVIRRYMTLSIGRNGDNNWDGRWACAQFVPGVAFEFDPPLNWSHTDEENPNVTIHRARNGQSWAYEEGPAARTFVGRQIGDVNGARAALRDLLRTLAKYAEEPIALLLDDERTEDQDRGLWLTRWSGGSHLDQQAYARRSTNGVIRGVGDEQIQFDELA